MAKQTELFGNYEENPIYKWYIQEIYDRTFFNETIDENSSPRLLRQTANNTELLSQLKYELKLWLEKYYRITHDNAENIINETVNMMDQPATTTILPQYINTGICGKERTAHQDKAESQSNTHHTETDRGTVTGLS